MFHCLRVLIGFLILVLMRPIPAIRPYTVYRTYQDRTYTERTGRFNGQLPDNCRTPTTVRLNSCPTTNPIHEVFIDRYCICTHTYTHAHIHTYTHAHTCTCTHMHTHAHARTCTHIHTCTCTHIHTCTCTHTYTHAHVHTHTHMHMYTHI